MKKTVGAALAVALFLAAGGYLIVVWTINRIYVDEGESLQLRYKGPILFGEHNYAQAGHWAKEGEIGVLEKLRGPGRHFYCPLWWERTIVKDVAIQPGEVGIVTCKLGEPPPAGEFLVDGEIGEATKKGTLRKVLGPGKYRINPYGYEVKVAKTEVEDSGKTKKYSGWVNIPTGFVGVVTNLTHNPNNGQKSGIQEKVLPPGIYPVNGREQQIDIVEIGYRESSIVIEGEAASGVDEHGEPNADKLKGGINFPSSDGFPIIMDFTAIWGLTPDQAPHAISMFGDVKLVENKVVFPQVESICRNNGSQYSAVDLLVGSKREEFQNKNLQEFHKVLEEKDITVLYGMVRHIYIPKEVRKPIQMAFIADELKLTREQEQKTTQSEAELREAEKKVELEAEKVRAETKKLVAERIANGHKVVGETEAETRKLVAAVEKQTAELQSQAKLVIAQAENDGKRMIEQAKAGRFKMAVEAFGSAVAFNNYVFANGLPENIDLKFLYAGPGTMWTDLSNAVRIMVPPPAKDQPKVTNGPAAPTAPTPGGG